MAVYTLNEYEDAKEFTIQPKIRSVQYGNSGKAYRTVHKPTYG